LAYETFPEGLIFSTFELEPEPGAMQTRGRPVPLLTDRLRFGGPQVTLINDRYRPDDQDLQAFVRANSATKRFVLALMALDFPLCDGPQLVGADVAVTLRDDGGPSETIAYSVSPLTCGSPYELSRGYTISPNLKIGSIGVGGQRQAGKVDHGECSYVFGGGELTANPSWTFRPTETQKLEGSTRLSLVIQVPCRRAGTMSVSVGAAIDEGRFRKRRVPLQGALSDTPGTAEF
jgi:hypothetical protein